jgi:CheY-like chemotaxis protein
MTAFATVPDQALILVVEDREDDIRLIRKAFQQGSVLNPLQVVRIGKEAIAYLSGVDKYANRAEYPLPELVLLDLKMPGLDGFDVLQWVRQQPGLKALRIVVLTSSDHIEDVNRTYELGANSFLVKPVNFADFIQTTKVLKGYWLWMSEAPKTYRPEPVCKQSQEIKGKEHPA